MKGLTNEEEDLIFEIEPKLFSIGTIIFSKEFFLLLNVRMSKNLITKESNPEQGTSYQITTKVVPSIVKLKDFCVRLEVSLKYKVYPKTYYHHN
jgi:hypothetical protein